MCIGVEYFQDGEQSTVYFDIAGAALPIRLRGGGVAFEQWGARGGRYVSDDNTPGFLLKFPIGGWAPLDSIKRGDWSKYEPQPVRIIASHFIQFDTMVSDNRSFPLQPGEFIQGLRAHIAQHRRVYVVTVPPPPERGDPERWGLWPRIVRSRVRAKA